MAAELPAPGGEVGAHLAIGELGRIVEGGDRLGRVLHRPGRAGVALRRGVAPGAAAAPQVVPAPLPRRADAEVDAARVPAHAVGAVLAHVDGEDGGVGAALVHHHHAHALGRRALDHRRDVRVGSQAHVHHGLLRVVDRLGSGRARGPEEDARVRDRREARAVGGDVDHGAGEGIDGDAIVRRPARGGEVPPGHAARDAAREHRRRRGGVERARAPHRGDRRERRAAVVAEPEDLHLPVGGAGRERRVEGEVDALHDGRLVRAEPEERGLLEVQRLGVRQVDVEVDVLDHVGLRRAEVDDDDRAGRGGAEEEAVVPREAGGVDVIEGDEVGVGQVARRGVEVEREDAVARSAAQRGGDERGAPVRVLRAACHRAELGERLLLRGRRPRARLRRARLVHHVLAGRAAREHREDHRPERPPLGVAEAARPGGSASRKARSSGASPRASSPERDRASWRSAPWRRKSVWLSARSHATRASRRRSRSESRSISASRAEARRGQSLSSAGWAISTEPRSTRTSRSRARRPSARSAAARLPP